MFCRLCLVVAIRVVYCWWGLVVAWFVARFVVFGICLLLVCYATFVGCVDWLFVIVVYLLCMFVLRVACSVLSLGCLGALLGFASASALRGFCFGLIDCVILIV